MKMRSGNKMEMCIKMSNVNKPVVYVAGLFSNGDTLPQKEQDKNKAPNSGKKLFQYLRELKQID